MPKSCTLGTGNCGPEVLSGATLTLVCGQAAACAPLLTISGHSIGGSVCCGWTLQRLSGAIDLLRGGLAQSPLDRDLRPYFHHPPGWNLEEVGRVAGRFCKRDKKTVLPARHARACGGLGRAA